MNTTPTVKVIVLPNRKPSHDELLACYIMSYCLVRDSGCHVTFIPAEDPDERVGENAYALSDDYIMDLDSNIIGGGDCNSISESLLELIGDETINEAARNWIDEVGKVELKSLPCMGDEKMIDVMLAGMDEVPEEMLSQAIDVVVKVIDRESTIAATQSLQEGCTLKDFAALNYVIQRGGLDAVIIPDELLTIDLVLSLLVLTCADKNFRVEVAVGNGYSGDPRKVLSIDKSNVLCYGATGMDITEPSMVLSRRLVHDCNIIVPENIRNMVDLGTSHDEADVMIGSDSIGAMINRHNKKLFPKEGNFTEKNRYLREINCNKSIECILTTVCAHFGITRPGNEKVDSIKITDRLASAGTLADLYK